MKRFILLALSLVALTRFAWSSGPTVITISTTDEGVSYAMRDHNYRVEKTFKRVEELEAWMRKNYAQENADTGEGVWLRPDDRTSFNTVFDLMSRFKGLKISLMLIEGKVENEPMIASLPLNEFRVRKMDAGGAQK